MCSRSSTDGNISGVFLSSAAGYESGMGYGASLDGMTALSTPGLSSGAWRTRGTMRTVAEKAEDR
jgi:hypothetical protein